jgi:hypothetical protein
MVRHIRISIFLSVFIFTKNFAQLSGLYTIPGNFPTIAAAISSLNIGGVSGQVTIAINAGYTETVTAGGYSLDVISGASAANQVYFQKNGIGANPLLVAYTNGTCTPQTAQQDGLLKFVGTDYVTIDGLDLYDPNTSNPSTMEYGYAFYKASATDGCQYNTIKNCTITLNKVNNFAGTWGGVDGCRGIELCNINPSSYLINLTITSSSGGNSFNKFYANTIQNVNIGIAMTGYASIVGGTNSDEYNEIGGALAGTGNQILNFGGGSNSPCAGISAHYQFALSVQNNYFNNNNGSGLNPIGNMRGLYIHNYGGTSNVKSNTLTLTGGGFGGTHAAIYTSASSSFAQSGGINATFNQFINCTYTTSPSNGFNAFFHSSSSQSTYTLSNNLVSNINFTGTGTVTLVQPGATTLTATGNTITNITHAGNSGHMWILTSGGNAVMSNNTLSDIGWSSPTSGGNIIGFYGGPPTFTLSNNTFKNFYTATTGSILAFMKMAIPATSLLRTTAFQILLLPLEGLAAARITGSWA